MSEPVWSPIASNAYIPASPITLFAFTSIILSPTISVEDDTITSEPDT